MPLFDFHFPYVPISTNFFRALSQPEALPQYPINFLELARRPKSFCWMAGIRRKIHENLELGFEDFETNKHIRAELHQRASLTNTQLLKLVLVDTSGPVHLLLLQSEQILDAFAMQVCFKFWIFQLSFLCLTFFFFFFFKDLLCERLWGTGLKWKFWD